MAKKRTVELIERDLKRARRASRRLKLDLDRVTRLLAVNGGVSNLPKKGEDEPELPSKILPTMRQFRELSRTLKGLADLVKLLEAEKVKLQVTVDNNSTDEYTL